MTHSEKAAKLAKSGKLDTDKYHIGLSYSNGYRGYYINNGGLGREMRWVDNKGVWHGRSTATGNPDVYFDLSVDEVIRHAERLTGGSGDSALEIAQRWFKNPNQIVKLGGKKDA